MSRRWQVSRRAKGAAMNVESILLDIDRLAGDRHADHTISEEMRTDPKTHRVFVVITWLLVVELVIGTGALAVPVMLHLRGDDVAWVVWMRLAIVLAMTTTLFYFAWRAPSRAGRRKPASSSTDSHEEGARCSLDLRSWSSAVGSAVSRQPTTYIVVSVRACSSLSLRLGRSSVARLPRRNSAGTASTPVPMRCWCVCRPWPPCSRTSDSATRSWLRPRWGRMCGRVAGCAGSRRAPCSGFRIGCCRC